MVNNQHSYHGCVGGSCGATASGIARSSLIMDDVPESESEDESNEDERDELNGDSVTCIKWRVPDGFTVVAPSKTCSAVVDSALARVLAASYTSTGKAMAGR